MEDVIIYLVIFFGWIVFKVIQAVLAHSRKVAAERESEMKTTRQPTAGTTERAPGLLVLEELKKAMEEGVEELGARVKHDLPGTPPDTFVSRNAPPPDVRRTSTPDIRLDHRTTFLIENAQGRLKSTPRRPPSLPLPAPPATEGRVPATISVERLRQAIVWSEILARPVSMRDDR